MESRSSGKKESGSKMNESGNELMSFSQYTRNGEPDHIEADLAPGTPETESDCETRCGYINWRPKCLQRLNKPTCLVFFVAMYSMLLGFVVNGINMVNVSTLERRFDLQSSQVGFLSSSYDISAATLAVIIGYFGSGKRKARVIAMAVFASALGSFVMTVPHFATGQYTLGMSTEKVCVEAAHSNSTCDSENNSELSNFWYVFLFAQLLHGIGGTTFMTVGISLIDDSVMPKKTPLCLGFVYGCNILGSGLGYIVGGQLLNLYIDFDTVADVDLTPSDTRWLGAWWLGPGIAAVLQLFIALPLSCFGEELPTCKEIRRKRVCQAHQPHLAGTSSAASTPGPHAAGGKRPSLVGYTLAMLRNPCFVFITLAMTMEGMYLSGTASFLPKFVENAYGISASKAAIWSGCAIIPAAAGGLMTGGYIAKRFDLNISQSIKFIIVTSSLAAAGSLVVWIRCDPLEIHGVTSPYHGGDKEISLSAPCNNLCNCDTDSFEPLCSPETGTYFSACYAGCRTQTGHNNFSDCGCVSTDSGPSHQGLPANFQLTSVGCRQACDVLYIFLIALSFAMCLSFMPIAPADSIQLRCVLEEHKTFAQGVKMLIIRIMGSFVGPILVGKLLDLNCRTWRGRCGQRLSCWLYDHDMLVVSLFLFILCCKLVSVLFCCLALKFYQAPKPIVVELVVEPLGGAVQDLEDTNNSFNALDPGFTGVKDNSSVNLI